MRKVTIVILFIMLSVGLLVGEAQADPPELPTMPICGDQDDPQNPPVYHCSDLVLLTDIHAFQVPGIGQIELVFDFVFREASFNNELGFFKVDDISGTIDGISPGEPGYLAAAFEEATIVFASGSNAWAPDVVMQLNGGDILVFFIIQNSSLQHFLVNNPDNDVNSLPLAFFSINGLNPDQTDHFVGFDSASNVHSHFGFEDQTFGGDEDYDDVVYNITPPIDPVCPPNSWFGEYHDNINLQGNPILTRCDTQLDFNWVNSSPVDNLPEDNFSIRWNRTVSFSQTGWYRFRTFADGGVRLHIDGQVAIEDWADQPFKENSYGINLVQGDHQIRMEYAHWSDDAMVDLDWYLCSNGENDCSLNITPMYQTQYLDSPMPTDCTSGSNQTIASVGCAITSVAMALQQYGVNTTPSELNQWLSERNGYTGGSCTANLNWPEVLKFAEDPKYGGVSLGWKAIGGVTEAITTIRDSHYPVIMQVTKPDGLHYTLAVDVINVNGLETFGINDPHHAWSCFTIPGSPPPTSVLQCAIGSLRHAITNPEENTYSGGVSKPLKYLVPITERTAALQIAAFGTEVILTDHQGQRVGYEKSTGQFLTDSTLAKNSQSLSNN